MDREPFVTEWAQFSQLKCWEPDFGVLLCSGKVNFDRNLGNLFLVSKKQLMSNPNLSIEPFCSTFLLAKEESNGLGCCWDSDIS